MPYNSETSEYERRATTVIDSTPDGDTVAIAIDVKLDQGIDDYVADLNHHNENGNHYPVAGVTTDSQFLKKSPAGVVSWTDGVVAAGAALKDFSNVAAGAIASDKLASVAPAKVTQDASNRFFTDAERTKLSGIATGAQVNADITKAEIEAKLTGTSITSHGHSGEIAASVGASGKVLQKVVAVSTSSFAITAQIPPDTSVPQSTEGTEFFTTSFTPQKAGSKILVTLSFCGIGDNAECAVALFQSGSSDAISAQRAYGIYGWNASITGAFTSEGASPVTISARGGRASGGTMYINRSVSTLLYGSSSVITMTIEEIAA